eukprot:328207-Rhodomonas_salina.1
MAARYVMCALIACMHASSVMSFLSPNLAANLVLKSHTRSAVCPKASLSSQFLGSFTAFRKKAGFHNIHNFAVGTRMVFGDDEDSVEDSSAAQKKEAILEDDERAVHVPAGVPTHSDSIQRAAAELPHGILDLLTVEIAWIPEIDNAGVCTRCAI